MVYIVICRGFTCRVFFFFLTNTCRVLWLVHCTKSILSLSWHNFFFLLLNPPNMRGIETLLQYDVTFQHFISLIPCPLHIQNPLYNTYSGIYIFYCQSYSYCDLVFGNRHLSFDIVIIIMLSIDCTTVNLFQLLLI